MTHRSRQAAKIELRTVVALEHGAVGVVTGVRTDGTLVIAVRGGQWMERGSEVELEILAGPEEPHPERRRIIDDWLKRPADWPTSGDDTTVALTRAMWTVARRFMVEHGLTLGHDINIDVHVTRPRVRVPSALKLRRDELLVPFVPSTTED